MGNGSTVTLTLNLTFNQSFAGDRVISMPPRATTRLTRVGLPWEQWSVP